MENKYYTPDLEDIHIGYECEIFEKDLYAKKEWEKIVADADTLASGCSECYYQDIKQIKLRTKYLDKQDIESLGWKLNGKLFEITLSNDYETFLYKLKHIKNENVIKITLTYTSSKENFKNSVCYVGTCSSINELRTIMKLIQISTP